jgi:putative transposase
MSGSVSPSTNRRYGVVLVASEWQIPRSSFYQSRKRRSGPARPMLRRGPRTLHTDDELRERIRGVLAASLFVGEGHRKVWAKLRHAGVRTSKRRVLRIMREANLLSPTRMTRVLGPRNHDGTIITEQPDQMWGTDATSVFTVEDGQATVFIAVDHCTAEGVGIHAAKEGNRFEALEPIRQGIKDRFGGYGANVAVGLQIRHDHGSQYMSDHFQRELRFLGAESSPAFVRAPEGNGCAERFIRTLKEQLLWVHAYRTVEELRLAMLEWLKVYNENWLIQRHGHRSPAQVRRDFIAIQAAA